MFATARTFLSNFRVPCLYVALGAMMLSVGPTACVTKRLSEGRVLRAERTLVEYQSSVATQTANAVQSALTRQREAWDAERARQDQIATALRDGDAAITRKMEVLRRDISNQIQTSLAAPEWSCLRDRLPDDVSGLFYRPGA